MPFLAPLVPAALGGAAGAGAVAAETAGAASALGAGAAIAPEIAAGVAPGIASGVLGPASAAAVAPELAGAIGSGAPFADTLSSLARLLGGPEATAGSVGQDAGKLALSSALSGGGGGGASAPGSVNQIQIPETPSVDSGTGDLLALLQEILGMGGK